jgi:hypothetical protein
MLKKLWLSSDNYTITQALQFGRIILCYLNIRIFRYYKGGIRCANVNKMRRLEKTKAPTKSSKLRFSWLYSGYPAIFSRAPNAWSITIFQVPSGCSFITSMPLALIFTSWPSVIFHSDRPTARLPVCKQ